MNLVASVLHLDRTAIQALRINDQYSLHRVIYGLYTDVRSETEKVSSTPSGILWADQGGDFHGRRILMLADRTPNAHAAGGYGQVQSRQISEGFLSHERYRFQVIVNPTIRESASGKLRPIKGREAVATWFAQRALASWGFEVSLAYLRVDRLDVLQFKDKAARPVTLAQAYVSGQLRVGDRDQFQKSFVHGIGRGRSFGCGLLQIVPLVASPFV